ncbi:hypothetical protein ULMA_02440 [Patiriisocius marinus]|uniref:ATPase dynein-related AAA domain-containing protein n=1 Tax=Patiriisocius marinus TaxID=1397112 RepID=A0A5J4IU53_9FLAO|nr:AAA family ATPase [Patiriisocius marinus]GER58136.1 hypothetical protein ULMA_02440 [Patiriisocius marinus]
MAEKQLQKITASAFFKLITKEDIQEAYSHITNNTISLKQSTKYSVLVNNMPFPPKDFIRVIANLKNYSIDEGTLFGGQTNKPFEALGYKVVNNQDYPFFNASILQPQIRKYQNAIDTTDWLKIHESYKFNFIKWLEDNIDFENDTNEAIKSKIEESQQQAFSPNSNTKGVNFIQTITRYQDDYITIEDIEKLRHIIANEVHESKENLTLSFGSFPKTSAYLCLFAPNRFMAYDGESIPAYEYLSKGSTNTNTAPKRNYKAFQFYQTFYKNIKEHLKESHLNTTAFTDLLQVETLTELHWNFITQDFLLYITRQIMNAKVPAYYCVGFHFYGENPTNQLPTFIENNIWINGYDDKFVNVVNEVPIGSLIAAKTSYTMNEDDKTISVLEVHCIGEVSGNSKDGKHLNVDWQKNFKSFILKRKGGYRSTISKVHNQTNIDAIFYKNDTDEELIEDENKETQQYTLNQILYGPPGTGKTYKTKKLAVEIIENQEYSDAPEDREIILEKYSKYVESENIHFTTFHQSMSYEDFIEGIKPTLNEDEEKELSYEIQDGIFKSICNQAKKNKNSIKKDTGTILQIEPFDTAWNYLVEYITEKLSNTEVPTFNTLTHKQVNAVGITDKGNLLFKPSAGSDLEYIISYNRTKKLFNAFPDLSLINNIDKEFRQVIGGSNSTAYWSVLNYLHHWIEENQDKIVIEEITDIPTKNQNYVLIIDEINRGNVSAIFGELITLIETDKRTGENEAISITLPYSKTKFSVPNNVFIIGTMNTADRSVEALDTALRRRFSFEEIAPNPQLLIGLNYKEVDLEKLLYAINQRIEILVDKDHQIGHSYFFSINNFDDLKLVFKDKIIPLLEEYFYGDFGKIGLVLGENFIEQQNVKNKSILAPFKNYDDLDFVADKKIFKLKPIDNMEVLDFISIYQKAES